MKTKPNFKETKAEKDIALEVKNDGKDQISTTKRKFNKFDKSKKTINTKRNDPKWYAISDAMGKTVANLTYAVYPGAKVDLGIEPTPKSTATNRVYDASGASIQGAMAIKYASIPGLSYSGDSALNVSARALYSWVRHANSGSKTYDAPDLMIYIQAMRQVYSAYQEATRIYRTVMTYNMLNRVAPDVLLRAMDCDPDDLRRNIAQFRAELNIFASKANSLAVPKQFKIYLRDSLLANNVFCDAVSETAQYYIFQQSGYYVYTPVAQTTGGSLTWKERTTKTRTAKQIIDELNEMLSPILEDEDMNVMSGDIRKAFGVEALFSLIGVDEWAPMVPVMSEEILSQIENLSFLPSVTPGDITQNNNVLLCIPTATITSASAAGLGPEAYRLPKLVVSHKEEPTWEDNLEYTRLINVLDTSDKENKRIICGTELITGISMYNREFIAGTGSNQPYEAIIKNQDLESSYVLLQFTTDVISRLSQYDWHPILYLYATYSATSGGGYATNFKGFMGDVKRSAIVSSDVIKRINDSVTLALLNTTFVIDGK